jgi:diguanylate cyclase (GGDEF)-like protein/PAS domain S-box-containing protein
LTSDNPERGLEIGAERVYRTLFEKSPEGLVFCDIHSRVIFVNDEFCRMFNYERKQIIGKPLDDIVTVTPGKSEEAKKLTEEYSRYGVLLQETERERSDGTSFPVSIVSASVLLDGTPAGSLTVYRDITEQKKQDRATRTAEAKLRGILDSHPELILRFTPDLVTTYANKAYCNYHGIEPEEATGKSFADHISPEYIPVVRSKLLPLTPGNPIITGEEKVIMSSGEIRWQEWTDQGIFNDSGELVEIQSVGRDITDRKTMEETLAFERESLNALFENASEGIVLCEGDGTIIRANPMFCEMFGYSSGEVTGRNIDDLVAHDSKLIGEARELTRSTFRGKSISSESTRMRKDGSTIEVSFLGIPVLMSGGTRYSYGIYRDISERKKSERELQRLNRELFLSATTDKVTGLLSRQHFEEILDRELAKSARYGNPLSLIMIDLDNFKKLNDSRGHLAGDRALLQIASAISDNIRSSDITARWGGDEFILATSVSQEKARELAEKLRKLLEKLDHNDFGPITGSFGISSFRDGDSIETLTGRADDLMYAVKRLGGNDIRSAP